MYAGGSRTSSSVSSGRAARDVLWERALSALPPVLLSALRAAELDDPRVLGEYPVDSLHDLQEYVGGNIEIGGAPSGAASSAHSPLSSSHSSSLPPGPSGSASSWAVDGVDTGKGGDPKTGHSLACAHEGGGDPRTDHALSGGVARLVGDSPHPGGLASQTAFPSPACTELGISGELADDDEVRDGCPSIEDSVHPDGFTAISQFPEHPDAFPSTAEVSDHRDGFPSSGDVEYPNTLFSRDLHTGKNSERVRESDSGIQIVPAGGSPSELSAHQMGLSLAGASRLKQEPIHFIPGASSYAMDGHERLSISDRALMRKYGLPGRQQEVIRKSDAGNETIPIVQRVDGHPPQGNLKLYDRMLLRKYSASGSASVPADFSSLVSVPCFSPPVESGEKEEKILQESKSGWRDEE